jgi:hypothetical protein
LYNQFIYDGNQYEKTTGYQVGMKYFGINNLTLQAEYNVMDNPYDATFEPELEQFTNYNESLAHPLGNNFKETVGIINYKYKRAFLEIKGVLISGNNSVARKITILQSHLGFLINPKNNMAFIAGVKIRKDDTYTIPEKTNYIYFGFRTNLRNLYDDF